MVKKQIINADFSKACAKLKSDDRIGDVIALSDNIANIFTPDGPRKMTFIIVMLCTEGSAQYTVDTREQVITKNDIVVISERHVIDHYVAAPDMRGLCMLMSVNFFYEAMRGVSDLSSLFLFSKNYPHVKLSDREASVFTDYFYMLKKKAGDKCNHFRRQVVQALFLAMFYDLSGVVYRVHNTISNRKTRANEIFRRFITLVEENYKRERRVGWYAETMGFTPKYLSETVREVSKRTPNEWIDSCVTLELRLQLRNTDKNIKEIAADLNFPNQSFLGKYFKEHVGMSPSDYRKS